VPEGPPPLLTAREREALVLAFGSRLRHARVTGVGLSEDELATRCGIAKATVTRTELGRREPGLCLILSLCRGLGVSPDALMGGLLPGHHRTR
jgi:transcriptional regulator with XRE-family HTH domain